MHADWKQCITMWLLNVCAIKDSFTALHPHGRHVTNNFAVPSCGDNWLVKKRSWKIANKCCVTSGIECKIGGWICNWISWGQKYSNISPSIKIAIIYLYSNIVYNIQRRTAVRIDASSRQDCLNCSRCNGQAGHKYEFQNINWLQWLLSYVIFWGIVLTYFSLCRNFLV